MGRRDQSNGGLGCMMWSLLGCGGVLALGVVVVVVIAFLVNQSVKRQAESLVEADRLLQAGKTDEAVAKYKDGYGAAGDRKAEVIRRIVDFEAGKGNNAEAKKWVERGLSDKLVLSFDSPGGRTLLADAQRDRDTKLAQQRVEDDARAKQRQADKLVNAKQTEAADSVKANRNKSREEFRQMLVGKGPDEVLRLIGKADRTIDTEATGAVWYYNRVAPDPASGKLSTAVITWDGAGLVKDVEFL
jgi:hypothetical protein